MSVEAMALVLHHSEARGTDKVVLLGIANHEGDGGAWPSIPTLAKYARVTDRNVQKSIERLVAAKELRVDAQAGGDREMPRHERPNRYRVLVRCPRECDGTTQHRTSAEPVSETTPGVADDTGSDRTPGVADDTPGGVADDIPPVSLATPKPPNEPSPEPSEDVDELALVDVPRVDVERLCDHLADRIAGDGSKRPTVTKAWRDAARLMLDRDGRDEGEVHRAIDWCQDHSFWSTNVLSMPTLRKQFDRLRKVAASERQRPRGRGDIDWDAAFDRAAARDAASARGALR